VSPPPPPVQPVLQLIQMVQLSWKLVVQHQQREYPSPRGWEHQ